MNPNQTQAIPDEAMIFGLLLIISNKMNTLLERELKQFDVTTKQWFLSETLNSLFDSPPTLKEVALAMGSSHQNVKQVALKLQQKGLLTLEKDKKDARVTRLRMTEQNQAFWRQTDSKGAIFREKMFKAMSGNDLARTRYFLEKMLSNLAEIENAVIDA
jgi:DNA-binding MarR family transcriptional regulator